MIEVLSYLYRTQEYSPFTFGNFKVSAYLLIRPTGNLLLYSSKHIENYYNFIQQKGGLRSTLISHQDEASGYINKVANQFDASFYSPEKEKETISKKCDVDKTFNGDVQLWDDFKIIATPGHSPGSSCFLWSAPDGKNILFTGDNLYPTTEDTWDAFTLNKNDVPEIVHSLEKIKNLHVDFVVPTGTSAKNLFFKEITNQFDWKRICDDAIIRIQQNSKD